MYISKFIARYVQLYILIDALIELETNADINVSSSAGDIAQNGRTAAMTSNAESEVPSTDQGMQIFYLCFNSPDHCL